MVKSIGLGLVTTILWCSWWGGSEGSAPSAMLSNKERILAVSSIGTTSTPNLFKESAPHDVRPTTSKRVVMGRRLAKANGFMIGNSRATKYSTSPDPRRSRELSRAVDDERFFS